MTSQQLNFLRLASNSLIKAKRLELKSKLRKENETVDGTTVTSNATVDGAVPNGVVVPAQDS